MISELIQIIQLIAQQATSINIWLENDQNSIGRFEIWMDNGQVVNGRFNNQLLETYYNNDKISSHFQKHSSLDGSLDLCIDDVTLKGKFQISPDHICPESFQGSFSIYTEESFKKEISCKIDCSLSLQTIDYIKNLYDLEQNNQKTKISRERNSNEDAFDFIRNFLETLIFILSFTPIIYILYIIFPKKNKKSDKMDTS